MPQFGPQLSPFHATTYRYQFEITATLPASLIRLGEGAANLLDPKTKALVLRGALATSLVPPMRAKITQAAFNVNTFRRNYARRLAGAVNMRRMNFRRGDPRPAVAVVRKYLRAANQMDAIRARGDARSLASAKRVLAVAREQFRRQLQPPHPAKNRLPHGQFRTLAFKVLEMIADLSHAKTVIIPGGVKVGMGNLAELNAIRTPSATDELTGIATTSYRATLWKHLEFGTGVFATDKSLQLPRHRLPNGGWWYGRAKGQALELRGSRPMKMLGDPLRAIQQQPGAVKFYTDVYALVDRALFGD